MPVVPACLARLKTDGDLDGILVMVFFHAVSDSMDASKAG